jgi:hypothetical protein
VRTLGSFEVLRDGQPLAFSRKLPRRRSPLLKGDHRARRDAACPNNACSTALWPDEEGDAGARALDATVLRLRTLLGDAAAIEQRGGRVSLNPQRVWVDMFAFDRALGMADEAAHRHDVAAEQAPLQRALALYPRRLPWWKTKARPGRSLHANGLRGRFIHALARHAESLEREGNDAGAIAAYLRGIDADPAIESFYQGPDALLRPPRPSRRGHCRVPAHAPDPLDHAGPAASSEQRAALPVASH